MLRTRGGEEDGLTIGVQAEGAQGRRAVQAPRDEGVGLGKARHQAPGRVGPHESLPEVLVRVVFPRQAQGVIGQVLFADQEVLERNAVEDLDFLSRGAWV